MDKNIKLSYYKVNTNSGPCYVCLAMKSPGRGAIDDTYKAAFAFYSSKEKVQFSKKLARTIALGRLNAENVMTFSPSQDHRFSDDKYSLTGIFNAILVKASKTTIVKDDGKAYPLAPGWFNRSIKRADITKP